MNLLDVERQAAGTKRSDSTYRTSLSLCGTGLYRSHRNAVGDSPACGW